MTRRFSKQRLGGHQEIELAVMDMHSTIKKPFIEEDLSTVNTIEEPKPRWKVQYEECQALLLGVDDLSKPGVIKEGKCRRTRTRG